MAGYRCVGLPPIALIEHLFWTAKENGKAFERATDVRAAASGRFLAISTSNFCGQRIAGMRRDVGWCRELTGVTKNAGADAELMDAPLYWMLR